MLLYIRSLYTSEDCIIYCISVKSTTLSTFKWINVQCYHTVCDYKDLFLVSSAVQGNNEVSMWDMETGDRKFTLWASSAPPLSEMQVCCHLRNKTHSETLTCPDPSASVAFYSHLLTVWMAYTAVLLMETLCYWQLDLTWESGVLYLPIISL